MRMFYDLLGSYCHGGVSAWRNEIARAVLTASIAWSRIIGRLISSCIPMREPPHFCGFCAAP